MHCYWKHVVSEILDEHFWRGRENILKRNWALGGDGILSEKEIIIHWSQFICQNVPANELIIRGVPLSKYRNITCYAIEIIIIIITCLLLPPPHHNSYDLLILKWASTILKSYHILFQFIFTTLCQYHHLQNSFSFIFSKDNATGHWDNMALTKAKLWTDLKW